MLEKQYGQGTPFAPYRQESDDRTHEMCWLEACLDSLGASGFRVSATLIP